METYDQYGSPVTPVSVGALPFPGSGRAPVTGCSGVHGISHTYLTHCWCWDRACTSNLAHLPPPPFPKTPRRPQFRAFICLWHPKPGSWAVGPRPRLTPPGGVPASPPPPFAPGGRFLTLSPLFMTTWIHLATARTFGTRRSDPQSPGNTIGGLFYVVSDCFPKSDTFSSISTCFGFIALTVPCFSEVHLRECSTPASEGCVPPSAAMLQPRGQSLPPLQKGISMYFPSVLHQRESESLPLPPPLFDMPFDPISLTPAGVAQIIYSISFFKQLDPLVLPRFAKIAQGITLPANHRFDITSDHFAGVWFILQGEIHATLDQASPTPARLATSLALPPHTQSSPGMLSSPLLGGSLQGPTGATLPRRLPPLMITPPPLDAPGDFTPTSMSPQESPTTTSTETPSFAEQHQQQQADVTLRAGSCVAVGMPGTSQWSVSQPPPPNQPSRISPDGPDVVLPVIPLSESCTPTRQPCGWSLRDEYAAIWKDHIQARAEERVQFLKRCRPAGQRLRTSSDMKGCSVHASGRLRRERANRAYKAYCVLRHHTTHYAGALKYPTSGAPPKNFGTRSQKIMGSCQISKWSEKDGDLTSRSGDPNISTKVKISNSHQGRNFKVVGKGRRPHPTKVEISNRSGKHGDLTSRSGHPAISPQGGRGRLQARAEERVQFLKRVSLLPDCSCSRQVAVFRTTKGDDLARVASFMHERTFPPKRVIFREGQSGDGIYVLRSGRVSIVRTAVIDRATAAGIWTVYQFVSLCAPIAEDAVTVLFLPRDPFFRCPKDIQAVSPPPDAHPTEMHCRPEVLWATVHRFFEDRIAKDLAPPSTTLEYFETLPAGCAPADGTVPAPRLQTRVPRNPRTQRADMLLFATLVKRGGIYVSFQAEEVLRDTHAATQFLRLQGRAKLARTPEEADRLAQHAFARILIVYAAVVKYFGLRGFSHLDLLLLQLYPERYLPISLFDQLNKLLQGYSLESCVVFLDTLLPPGTPVMIDEAHLLCEEGLLADPSGHAGTTHTTNSPPRKDGVSIASPRPDHPPSLLRPAVSTLLRVLNSLHAFSVLAGTGVRLTKAGCIQRALSKQGDLPVFCNFGGHSTEAEVRQFLLGFVPDPAYWGTEIPKRFIGRHRFAASLVAALLSKACPLTEAADSVAKEACYYLEHMIARLMEPPVGSLSLGVIFEKMMVQYCLLGRPTALDERAAGLVEMCVATVRMVGRGRMQVLVGEPMVFAAYCNYLKACQHDQEPTSRLIGPAKPLLVDSSDPVLLEAILPERLLEKIRALKESLPDADVPLDPFDAPAPTAMATATAILAAPSSESLN
ncbi:hypothetical protein PAPYR_12819 [Paratrimastix pyriformis]|uniref:Cyclic nucleotide-binding domain-containing protein n=1 Tax=Paratrimastix pyriformis TaxID=342808 RepID=A0ABQ8U3I0_9EUKA|nr:hypothetical protein PAPYR_12819 [Paratrimastix pyriformis]